MRSTSCGGNLCTNIRKVGVSVKHRKLVRLPSRNFYLPSFYARLPTHLTVHVFSITHLPAVVEIGCWNRLMRKKLNTFESKKFQTKWKFKGIFQFLTHKYCFTSEECIRLGNITSILLWRIGHLYLSNIYFSREYCSTIDNVLSKVSTQIEDCKQRTFTTKWIQSRFYISFCLLKNSFHMMVNREVLFHTESTLSENFQTFFSPWRTLRAWTHRAAASASALTLERVLLIYTVLHTPSGSGKRHPKRCR